jgi:hypothetical protein
MASRRSRSGIALGFAILLASVPAFAEPTAAEKETARNLMQEGRDLRDAKDLRGALQRFLAADQLMGVPTTGYEVAATQVALGLLVEARETLGRVRRLAVQPKEPPPFKEARQKAEALDDTLDARIPAVTVIVKGGVGAKLTVDDIAVPPALVGLPLRIDPGHHTIVGNLPTTRGEVTVDLVEGDKKQVELLLAPKIADPPLDTGEPPPTTTTSKGSYVPAILAFGLAGAGVAVGTITGVMTLSKQSDLAAACPNKTCGPAQHGDIDSANALGLVSTIAFIAAGSSAALGIVLFFVGKPSAVKVEAARVEPWIGLGAVGARGTF